MQSDYGINSFKLEVSDDISVSNLYLHLLELGYVSSGIEYGMSVFGDRVKKDYLLSENDRFELCLPLPSDPMQRRRNLALKRKNR